MAKYKKLDIQVAHYEYPIYIGRHLLSDVELLRTHVNGNQVLIVTNNTIAPLYLEKVSRAFNHIQCDVVVLADGETHKDKLSLFTIYDALIGCNHHRDTTLIALGGGVIGDITGFAAATFQRGVNFIQIPTTLLAQVDASIGGKTAINHLQAKNMIGSFHQPQAVIMDIETLNTLPVRELRAGFAEVIKHAILIGGDFLNQCISILSKDLTMITINNIENIILLSCQVKEKFVQLDEREIGVRVLLNLGHTFAHALESYTNYTRWLHGEAVAIGLYCAALLSCEMSIMDEANLKIIDDILHLAQLPRRIPRDIDLGALHDLMIKDKKIKNNQLPFVLIRSFGDCYLDKNVSKSLVQKVLARAVDGIIS